MKTFKDIINEVAEPKGGDEKRFKDKHVVAKYDHPAAEDEQFTAKDVKKDKTKKASYKDDKDAEVYEGYVSDAQRKAVHASKDEQKKKKKSFKEMFSGQDLAEDPWEEVPMMARQMEFICEAAEDIKEYVMSGVDPEEWFQNKVAHIHGQMQGLYAYVEGDERMKSAKMADMNPMGEEVEVLDENKALLKDYQAMKDQGKKDSSIVDVLMSMPKYKKMSRDQMTKTIGDAKRKGIFKEEVELDEAFKMGSMKLKDGSTVKLSKEEAEAVNELFSELNSSNKKRMEEEMMKDKSGFDKVLKFAKEAM